MILPALPSLPRMARMQAVSVLTVVMSVTVAPTMAAPRTLQAVKPPPATAGDGGTATDERAADGNAITEQVPRSGVDPVSTPPGADAAAAAPPEAPRSRLPLLREGSFLVRAPATLHFDPKSGSWLLTLRDDLETVSDRVVAALPSEGLEDMIGHIRGRMEVQWFDLTAMVVSYRGRNFLLPLMGTPLSAEPARQPRAALLPPGAFVRATIVPGPGRTNPLVAPIVGRAGSAAAATPAAGGAASSAVAAPVAAPAGERPADVSAPATPVDPERFAADIERALDERIQVVPRSSDSGAPALPPVRDSASRGDEEARVMLASQQRLQDRRGVVTRDPVSGTWRFVFQGERSDLGERGIELLPSTVLERIERFVRQGEMPPALLLSGQITRFEGRNYLLPTSFRTIASGRWITP